MVLWIFGIITVASLETPIKNFKRLLYEYRKNESLFKWDTLTICYKPPHWFRNLAITVLVPLAI